MDWFYFRYFMDFTHSLTLLTVMFHQFSWTRPLKWVYVCTLQFLNITGGQYNFYCKGRIADDEYVSISIV